jgi:hypothetical protein
MTAKHKLTISTAPPKYSPTATERRAAQVASVAGRQAELKSEAAERRARRAQSER